MPYLIASRQNPNSQQLVDDLDVSSGAAERAGYSVVRYVSDTDADTLAQSGTASTIGPAPLDPVGYDPTAPQTHAAAADAVNFANAATNRTNAETNYLSTLGSQFLEARGPKNLFQFDNAMIGQPKATIPAWATALKGMGELVYSPIADADRNALALSDFTRSGKTATSVGAGGGDAVTQQRAGQATGGTQGGVQSSATSAAQPPRGYGQTGQVWSPELGRWVDARGAQTAAVSHGAGTTPGPIGAAAGYYGLLTPPASAAVSPVAAVANPLGGVNLAPGGGPPMLGAGRVDSFGQPLVDTSQYGALGSRQALDAAGGAGADTSVIPWKRKLHQLVRSKGYGTGSAARSAAYQAAGLSGSDFNRLVKHGKDPFARQQQPIAAAAGYSGVARSGADPQGPTDPNWPGNPLYPGISLFPPPGGDVTPQPGDVRIPVGAQPTVGGNPAPYPPARDPNPAPYPPATPPDYHPHVGGAAAVGGNPAPYPPAPAPDYHPHVGVGSNPTGGPVVAGGAPTHAAAAAAGARASGRPAAIAAQQAEYQRLMTIASHWYAHQFGTDLGTAITDLQSTDPDTQAYLRSALGMARAGEIQAQLGLDDQGNPIARTAAPAPAAAAPAYAPAPATSPWNSMTPAQQAAAVAQTTNQRGVPPGGGAGQVYVPALGRWIAQVPGAAAPVHAAGGFQGRIAPAGLWGGTSSPDQSGGPTDPALMQALMAQGSGGGSGGDAGGAMPMDTGMGMGGPNGQPDQGGMGLDPTNPQQPPEALQQIAMILQSPPAPTDGPLEQAVRENWTLGHDGQPHFVGTAAQGAQQATALAQGGSFVVTDPTAFTVNGQPFVTGEQSRDELVRAQPLGQGATRLQVVPLQRPGMAVPRWAAQQANALVPGSPYHATPAWAHAPIHMATGGTATVYGSGSPSVLYGGSTVTNAARPVGNNTGISETGQVSVANRGRGYSTRPVPFPYTDPNRWSPVVAAQIQANPSLLAAQNSGLSSIGLDPASTWAAFYSSLPRQNPGTATRLAGAF